MANGINDEELFRHLWKLYVSTIDGRQKHGDLELLAEAAERMVWPGAPELGRTMGATLRELAAKGKTGAGTLSKHHRNVRDREIVGLARIHKQAGLTALKSYKRLAEIYVTLTPDGVRKIVERATEDKESDK